MCTEGHLYVLRMKEAKIEMQNQAEQMIDAILKNDIGRLRRLLNATVSPNQLSRLGFAPIHCAAETSNEKAVELLLGHGANPNITDANDMTPLGYCAADGNEGVANALLQRGAITDMLSKGYTPLTWAAQEGHEVLVKVLAAHKADIDVASEYKITPLFNSSGEGNLSMVRLLLDLGADVNHVEPVGTALHNACAYSNYKVVTELVERGADTNVKDGEGRVPLSIAAQKGDFNVAKYLIQNGAKKNFCDKDNKIPLDYAKALGDANIVGLLED